MAIVSHINEAGEEALYDIPDSELAKYKVNSEPLTEEVRARLFPNKDKLTKDDANGVMLVAPDLGDEVEAYQAICRYWIIRNGQYYYWYDYC